MGEGKMARQSGRVMAGKSSVAGKLRTKNLKTQTLLNQDVDGRRNKMTFSRISWR